MKFLLYCDKPLEGTNAQTITDHINSFKKYSCFDFEIISSRDGLPHDLNLSKYDGLIIHYSITLITTPYKPQSYIPFKDQEKIRQFCGIKIIFIQDEYRRVNYICEKIKYLKIDILFSCAPNAVAEKIYESILRDVQIYETLTGYLPENIKEYKTPHVDREIDVLYRGRTVPFWLGSLGQEKHMIGSKFQNYSIGLGLNIDISSEEKNRIYGNTWIETLYNARTTLGTESGASIVDFTGDIERDVAIHKYHRPEATYKDLGFLSSIDKKISIQVISLEFLKRLARKRLLFYFLGNILIF